MSFSDTQLPKMGIFVNIYISLTVVNTHDLLQIEGEIMIYYQIAFQRGTVPGVLIHMRAMYPVVVLLLVILRLCLTTNVHNSQPCQQEVASSPHLIGEYFFLPRSFLPLLRYYAIGVKSKGLMEKKPGLSGSGDLCLYHDPESRIAPFTTREKRSFVSTPTATSKYIDSLCGRSWSSNLRNTRGTRMIGVWRGSAIQRPKFPWNHTEAATLLSNHMIVSNGTDHFGLEYSVRVTEAFSR